MNTIFISIDDLFSLGAWPEYRSIARTPNLDAFSEGSTVFENAFSAVALCNPSRSSVLSGQSPWNSGIVDNNSYLFTRVDPAQTLPGVLRAAGVEVALGGKVFHELPDETSAIADRMLGSGGFRNGYSDAGTHVGNLNYGTTSGMMSDDRLADAASRFLSGAHESFFLALGIYRPHADWVVPKRFFDLYDRDQIPVPDFNDISEFSAFGQALAGTPFHDDVLNADAWVDLIHAYLASVSYADYVFGRMIQALEASEYASSTNVVVWSDHGFHLGDKQYWHKFTVWEEAARAPLMIREAGQTVGKIISTPVSLVDIYSTTLELAGVDISANVDSNSLVPLIRGEEREPEGVITWLYGSFSLRTEEYRYIRYEDGSEELYDIVADVHQTKNLFDNLSYAGALAEIRAAAIAQLASSNIFTGAGDLVGTSGDDVLLPTRTQVTLSGGDGDDTYVLRPGTISSTIIVDTGGNDTVFGNREIVLPFGIENFSVRDRTGSARVYGNFSDNILTGGAIDDELYGAGGNDTLIASGGNDLLSGGAGDDVLRARSGSNQMFGGAGDDRILGGTGDDTLYGDSGRDRIEGRGGNDFIDGGYGNDYLSGGLGNDRLFAGGGWDTVFGDGGDDVIEAGSAGRCNASGGDGSDVIRSSGALLMANGDAGDDRITGGAGNDVLGGGGGNDTLAGGEGDDELQGGPGNDTLTGGDGDDVLHGGMGVDTLVGGAGADVFRFDDASSSRPGEIDTVRDFELPGAQAGDRFDLSHVDADVGPNGNQSFQYGGSQGAGPIISTVGYFWFVNVNGYTFLNARNSTEGGIDFSLRIDDGNVLASAYTEHDVIVA